MIKKIEGYLRLLDKAERVLRIVVEQPAVGADGRDQYHALLLALERLNSAHLDVIQVLILQQSVYFVYLEREELDIWMDREFYRQVLRHVVDYSSYTMRVEREFVCLAPFTRCYLAIFRNSIIFSPAKKSKAVFFQLLCVTTF